MLFSPPVSSRRSRSVRVLALAALLGTAMVSGLVGVSPAASAGTPKVTLSQPTDVRAPGEWRTVTATVKGADGQPAADGTMVKFTISGPAGAISVGEPVVGLALATGGTGGWIARSDGTVSSFGTTPAVEPPTPVSSPAIELAATPSGAGYWMTTAAGHVLTAGDATYFGDLGNITLNGPIQAMAPTPTGKGYWMVANDGGIFAFGDAAFYGSTGGLQLRKPISGIMATPSGRGYWLFASDGAVFAFGDAGFYGSTGDVTLPMPIVDAVPTPL